MTASATTVQHDVEPPLDWTATPAGIRAATAATEVLRSALEPFFTSMLDRFTGPQQQVTTALPTCCTSDRLWQIYGAGSAGRWAEHALALRDGAVGRSLRLWSAASTASASRSAQVIGGLYDDWLGETTGTRVWTVIKPSSWNDADVDLLVDLPAVATDPLGHIYWSAKQAEAAQDSSLSWGDNLDTRASLANESAQDSLDSAGGEHVASSRETNPVQVVGRIAEVLGVTQLDVLNGADIAERTFYDWKANGRTPRLASIGLLWALDQAAADVARLIPEPATWMRSDPRRREAVRSGHFDGLVEAALREAVLRGSASSERAAQSARHAAGSGSDAFLDIPASGRPSARVPVSPRKPRRRRTGGQS